VRIEKGELIVSPLRAEEAPAHVSILQQAFQESLPLVELTDLLVEVDGWTHFSGHLESVSGNEPHSKKRLTHLYAAILAAEWQTSPEQLSFQRRQGGQGIFAEAPTAADGFPRTAARAPAGRARAATRWVEAPRQRSSAAC
jgi:hypothetical protein